MSDTSDTDPAGTTTPDTVTDDDDPCAQDNGDDYHGLRIGAIFIILVS